MDRVALILDRDSPEFIRAGNWLEGKLRGEIDLITFFNTQGMTSPAQCFDDQSISHLAIFCHGSPYGFGKPGRFGVDVRSRKNTILPLDFAEIWGPKLADDALISLAACLCSRNPTWYLKQIYGEVVSPWGPASYKDGGIKSVAGVLSRSFQRPVRVRGHCAAGHTIYQALLRGHEGDGMGESLFGKILPGMEPTLYLRRKWQKNVKGELAARWLLGLGDVEETILDLMTG